MTQQYEKLQSVLNVIEQTGAISRADVDSLGRYKTVITDVHPLTAFTTLKSQELLHEAKTLLKTRLYELRPTITNITGRVKLLNLVGGLISGGTFTHDRDSLNNAISLFLNTKVICIIDDAPRKIAIKTMRLEDVFGDEDYFTPIVEKFPVLEEALIAVRADYKKLVHTYYPKTLAAMLSEVVYYFSRDGLSARNQTLEGYVKREQVDGDKLSELDTNDIDDMYIRYSSNLCISAYDLVLKIEEHTTEA